mmetsp:Transcript_22992/g.47843  ORF Transcript_22992/g.47843 Transcript_22992/m.47843 type:complete len:290 (+) Transcript_22992:2772-3641(+)
MLNNSGLVPLGRPVLRYSDLNDNSTRYDYLAAAPSDEDLVKMWIFTGIVSAICAMAVAFVLISVLLSKKARTLSFNIYLVGFMVPDFSLSFFCAMICFMSTAVGHYYSPAMCRLQSWVTVFGITSNGWMAMLILKELHVSCSVYSVVVEFHPPCFIQVPKILTCPFFISTFVTRSFLSLRAPLENAVTCKTVHAIPAPYEDSCAETSSCCTFVQLLSRSSGHPSGELGGSHSYLIPERIRLRAYRIRPYLNAVLLPCVFRCNERSPDNVHCLHLFRHLAPISHAKERSA